jgi:predicted RNA polymerase sigma factor
MSDAPIHAVALRQPDRLAEGQPRRDAEGHNIAIDVVRRARTFSAKREAIVADLTRSGTAPPLEPARDGRVQDDELRMILMCCHPDIPADARVALSLKIIGGLACAKSPAPFCVMRAQWRSASCAPSARFASGT